MKSWVCSNCGMGVESIIENPTCITCMMPMLNSGYRVPSELEKAQDMIASLHEDLARMAAKGIAEALPQLQGAKDLAFELGADICSDHCDTDPCEPEEMAHCSWCDQASRLYRMLRDVLKEAAPAQEDGK